MSNVTNKLHRLMNPRTAEDYGLSVTRSELMTVPEFAEAIAEIEPGADKSAKLFKDCLQRAENTRASLVLNVLMGGP